MAVRRAWNFVEFPEGRSRPFDFQRSYTDAGAGLEGLVSGGGQTVDTDQIIGGFGIGHLLLEELGSVHPADLLFLGDGRILLVTGYRVGPYGVRGVVSDKNGVFNWEKRFVLVNDAISGDCGYPSSVLLKDGKILTVYYATKCKEKPEWGVHCGAVVCDVP